MPITEGTQPAPVQWSGAWTTAQTSASFTPESGALLVCLIAGDGAISASPNVTATVADSLSGTWTELVKENTSTTLIGGYAGVWVSDSPGAAMTVSVTGHGNTQNGGQFVVRTLIGAAAAASQTGATAAAAPNGTALSASVAAGTGNMVYGAIEDYDTNTTLTMLANTTSISNDADATNGDTYAAVKSSSSTAGTATYGSSTTAHGMVAFAEILASSGTNATVTFPQSIHIHP